MTRATPAVVPARHPDLAGQIAVVTGASRGIGAATVRALIDQGAQVAAVSRSAAPLAALADELGLACLPCPADCTDDRALAGVVDRVHGRWGEVSVLCCFAGGNGSPAASADLTAEQWGSVLDSELSTTFLTVTAFLPDLVATSGAVVTMSSAAGSAATRANAAYAAAKAGVAGLTRHLAGELAPHGVRVNGLSPAAVANERWRAAMPADALAAVGARFPLGRLGQPEDVASAALFLASAASAWLTGVVLDLDGGDHLTRIAKEGT